MKKGFSKIALTAAAFALAATAVLSASAGTNESENFKHYGWGFDGMTESNGELTSPVTNQDQNITWASISEYKKAAFADNFEMSVKLHSAGKQLKSAIIIKGSNLSSMEGGPGRIDGYALFVKHGGNGFGDNNNLYVELTKHNKDNLNDANDSHQGNVPAATIPNTIQAGNNNLWSWSESIWGENEDTNNVVLTVYIQVKNGVLTANIVNEANDEETGEISYNLTAASERTQDTTLRPGTAIGLWNEIQRTPGVCFSDLSVTALGAESSSDSSTESNSDSSTESSSGSSTESSSDPSSAETEMKDEDFNHYGWNGAPMKISDGALVAQRANDNEPENTAYWVMSEYKAAPAENFKVSVDMHSAMKNGAPWLQSAVLVNGKNLDSFQTPGGDDGLTGYVLFVKGVQDGNLYIELTKYHDGWKGNVPAKSIPDTCLAGENNMWVWSEEILRDVTTDFTLNVTVEVKDGILTANVVNPVNKKESGAITFDLKATSANNDSEYLTGGTIALRDQTGIVGKRFSNLSVIATSSDDEETSSTPDTTPSNVQTGEAGHLLVYPVILVSGLMMAAVVLLACKRSRQRQ